MYKLIAVDMDGTLLKEDKTISYKTHDAVMKAKEKGVKIVLATGRPLEGITDYLNYLGLNSDEDYVVTFNGAVVQSAKKRVISEILMSGAELKDLYSLSKKLKVHIHAFSPEGCITPQNSKYTQTEAFFNHIAINTVSFDNIEDDAKIIKVMLVDEPEKLDAAISRIPKEYYDKYTIVKSAPYFLEFLNKDANKGTGVKFLAKSLNIKQEETICIGDAGNDLHMIKYAGVGVAMDNAFPEIKAAADYITYSNEDDGVAHVIEKFVGTVTENSEML